MEEKDLKQIKEIVDQSVHQGFECEFPKAFEKEFGQIWEHNIAPAFDGVYKRLDGVEGRLDKVEGKMDGIDGRLDRIDGRLNRIESQYGDQIVS